MGVKHQKYRSYRTGTGTSKLTEREKVTIYDVNGELRKLQICSFCDANAG